MSKRKLVSWVICLIYIGFLPVIGEASDPQILKPRVPSDQIDEVRTWANPFPSTPQNIAKGKALFHGKAFCVTSMGRMARDMITFQVYAGSFLEILQINHGKPREPMGN